MYVYCLYSRTPKHLEHKLTLELEFRSLLSTCTLLYSHQDEDGLGDFLSLTLIQGFVELRYNLGDGFVTIKSLEPVQLGTWNRIVVKRLVYVILSCRCYILTLSNLGLFFNPFCKGSPN